MKIYSIIVNTLLYCIDLTLSWLLSIDLFISLKVRLTMGLVFTITVVCVMIGVFVTAVIVIIIVIKSCDTSFSDIYLNIIVAGMRVVLSTFIIKFIVICDAIQCCLFPTLTIFTIFFFKTTWILLYYNFIINNYALILWLFGILSIGYLILILFYIF